MGCDFPKVPHASGCVVIMLILGHDCLSCEQALQDAPRRVDGTLMTKELGTLLDSSTITMSSGAKLAFSCLSNASLDATPHVRYYCYIVDVAVAANLVECIEVLNCSMAHAVVTYSVRIDGTGYFFAFFVP